MCHAYSITIGVEAIRQIVRTLTVGLDIGNFEPSKGIYPGMLAPIIRHTGSLLEISRVVWGMPAPSILLIRALRSSIARRDGILRVQEQYRACSLFVPFEGKESRRFSVPCEHVSVATRCGPVPGAPLREGEAHASLGGPAKNVLRASSSCRSKYAVWWSLGLTVSE